MEGFKDLFQGGNCNPQMQQNNSNNAFKNFMNNLTITPQQLNQVQNQNSQQGLNNMMNNYNQIWQTGEKNFLAEQQKKQFEMQKMWQMEQERLKFQKQVEKKNFEIFNSKNLEQQKEMPLRAWNQNFFMGNQMMNGNQFFELDKKKEVVKEEVKVNEEEQNYQANDELIEMMETDPDPKFQKSEFLDFLKNIQSRKYEIKDNILTVNKEAKLKKKNPIIKMTENYENFIKSQLNVDSNIEEHLEKAKEEAESKFNDIIKEENTNIPFQNFTQNNIINENIIKEDKIKEDKEENLLKENEVIKEEKEIDKNKVEEMWQEMLDNYDEKDPLLKEKLDKIWKESLKNYETYGDIDYLAESWQNATDLEEMQYQNFSETYNFNKENKFVNKKNPLAELKTYLAKGNPHLVVEILEAHLQKNPQDSKGWQALGVLLQELDLDQPSVTCFLNSVKYAPKNSNALLQLGVSCTNIFDKIHAMSFLEKWLQNSENYKSLNVGENLISEIKLKEDNWKTEDIIKISHKLIEKFTSIEKASQKEDVELMNCLAIVHFISCDYQKALFYFQKILKFDPNNYSIWNKIGATFALLKNTPKAQECYHKALDLKPNYIRVWANLAINFNMNKDYKNASMFFLNSLALNPKARHLWAYLEGTFISSGYTEGIKKMSNFDLENFKDMHNVHGFEDLPKPLSINYVDIFEKYNLNGCLNDWVKQFDPKN